MSRDFYKGPEEIWALSRVGVERVDKDAFDAVY